MGYSRPRWCTFLFLLCLAPTVVRAAGDEVQTPSKKRGTLAGEIVAKGSEEPLAGVEVAVYNLAGWGLAAVRTNAHGIFRVRGLRAGTYYVVARPGGEHLPGLYDGLPCGWHSSGYCDPRAGTPVVVDDDMEAYLRIALLEGGRISGRVTLQPSGEPVAGISVVASGEGTANTVGGPAFEGKTDAEGHYELRGLPAGTYRLDTGSFDGYLVRTVEAVVEANAETSGVDLVLAVGGSISGTVIDEASGEPLAYVGVAARGEDGLLGIVFTDAAGKYEIVNLPAGTYSVEVRQQPYYYLAAAVEDVSVAAGEETRGIDLALVSDGIARGAISGQVTSEVTGEPLPGVSVYTSGGPADDTTDQDGRYLLDPLDAGTYRVQVIAYGYDDEAYDDVACHYCGPHDGAAVEVEAGRQTSGIDFALVKSGSALVRVVDEENGEPLLDGYVFARDAFEGGIGRPVGGDGTVLFDSLDSGEYFFVTAYNTGYVDEAYPDLPCPFFPCDLGGAVGVSLRSGTEAELTLELPRAAALSGRLSAAATSHRLPGVEVQVFDEAGRELVSVSTDENGVYEVEGLDAGRYYLATPGAYGYVGKLYGGVPCPFAACDVTAGQAVRLDRGETRPRLDIELELGGTVTGRVAGEGLHSFDFGRVELFDGSGAFLTWANRGADGTYRIEGLPPGPHYLRGRGTGHVAALYGGVPCAFDCDVTTGMPVTVEPGETLAGADFVLEEGALLDADTFDASTGGELLNGVLFDAYDEAGRWLLTFSPRHSLGARPQVSGSQRETADGFPPGTYFLRARAAGYLTAVYEDLPCPFECDVTTGTPILLAKGDAKSLRFDLEPAGRLAGTVTEAATGQAVEDLLIRLYDRRGRRVAATTTDDAGLFAFASVPAGAYYLRTPDTSTYHGELYDDVPCPRGCRITRGTKVEVAAGAVLTGLDFDLSLRR